MNNTRATVGGALLWAALGLAATGTAQDQGVEALVRAQAIEELEGDLRSAESAYRSVVEAAGTADPVRGEARLRLGRLLWRLGREDEARPLLESLQQAGGEHGAAAAAVLLGQDPAAQGAAATTQRVRDAIAQLLGEQPTKSNAWQDLEWLGAAAIPEVLRQIEARRAAAVEAVAQLEQQPHLAAMGARLYIDALSVVGTDQKVMDSVQLVRGIRMLLALVWSAGGEPAAGFLRTACADADVHWRRLVAATSRAADGALLPLVVDLLRDQDPAGIVPILALEVPDRLPIAAIVAALDAEVAAVRTGAWQAIQRLNMWDQGLVAPMEEAVQLLAPHLQKAFGDPDPETARTAFAFLCTKAAGTRAGSDLLLDWLPRVPSFSASMVQVALKGSLAAVLRAAKALGPVGSTDGKGERRSVVVRLTVETVRSDPAPTVAAICELVELGYEPPHSSVLKYAVPLARSDEDWLRIGALLDRCTDPLEVMQEFRERDLPGGMVPALQQRLASVLRELPAGDTQTPQPNSLRNEVHMLFDALGRTGNPAAVAFLREQLAARPDWADTIAWAALLLSDRSQEPAVAALLRELLVSPALDKQGIQRNLVFAELAERGDVDAIPLYPKAYELGLAVSVRAGQSPMQARRGAQWLAGTLASVSTTGARTLRQLHGYDDAQLAEAWRLLLASPALPDVLTAVADLEDNPGVLAEAVLLQLAELLAERLPVLLRSVEASMPAVDQARAPGPTTATGRARTGREVLLEVLGRTARATPAGDAPEAQRHRAAIGRLLRDEEFGAFVATRLPAQIVPLFADAIRPLLAGRSALDVMRTLQAAGVPLTTAELLACLRSQSYGRPQFLMSLPPDAPPEVVREVEGLVRDPDLSVRIGACEALGRTLSPDSVAALLPALRDATEGVRTAAAEALQRIRLYHEQKAFWDQFQQGITTGREAAAGKLLLQAKPEQPKEQRLLAIRSLGALGAPEALPYLIDWCQDGDAEVAAAARAAIGSIHQQAGGK